jgi:hypothetical protein
MIGVDIFLQRAIYKILKGSRKFCHLTQTWFYMILFEFFCFSRDQNSRYCNWQMKKDKSLKQEKKKKKTIVRRHLYKETKAPHTTSNGRGRRDTLREPKEDHFGGWNMLHVPTQYNRSPTCQRMLNTYQLFLFAFFTLDLECIRTGIIFHLSWRSFLLI